MTKTIDLTREQNECVNYSAGDLLVKGVAGSGKSYVILKRALKIHNAEPRGTRIRIFTYANTLVTYTDELLRAKLGTGAIEVSTVDSYFLSMYRAITGRSPYIDPDVQREVVARTLRDHKEKGPKGHRFYEQGDDFWDEEFMWIEEKCITTVEEYIAASRKGRGSHVIMRTDEDKRLAWDMYQSFFRNMRNRRCTSWPQIYMYLYQHPDRIPEHWKMDYVFVDEAQDMTLGKLRALKAITRKSITIAADMAQKIYKTSFTWAEAGIDIRGRASKSLTKSFRSTRQIVTLAEDLMAASRNDETLRDELTEAVLPESEGPLPSLLVFENRVKEESYLYAFLGKLREKFPDKVIGVICSTRKYLTQIGSELRKKGIPYERIAKLEDGSQRWELLRPGIKAVVAKSSKGLEFDIVVIPNLDEESYPLIPGTLDEAQLEEFLQTERNVLYVAMTRAREALFMLCTEPNRSRFIQEFDKGHYMTEKIS